MTEAEIQRRLEEQDGRCAYPCEDGRHGAPLREGDELAVAFDSYGLVHLRCARVGQVPPPATSARRCAPHGQHDCLTCALTRNAELGIATILRAFLGGGRRAS